jgi:2TM domain
MRESGAERRNAMNPRNHLTKARNWSDAKLGFYIHLGVYLLVNAGLIAINLNRTPDHWWFQWPLLGWGIGVLAHGLAVFLAHKRP